MGNLEDIPQDEVSDDVGGMAEEEMGPVDTLLDSITNNYWYPKGLNMDVLTVVKTLCKLI